MKLVIEKDEKYSEAEIIIRCSEVDSRLDTLIRQIRQESLAINGKKDGRSCMFTTDSIFYFESVEEKTFLYLENEVYECGKRLYELEELLRQSTFVRISKACLLNTSFVESVRPLLGRRLEAQLDNGERLIVNRHYVPEFKTKFGLEESGI